MRAVPILAFPIALAAAMVASGCSQTPASTAVASADYQPERQCFQPSQISNFRAGDDQKLYVRSGRNAVYELDAAGACNDLDFALQLAIVPAMGASSLCTGDWAAVVTSQSPRAEVCRARISRRLTDAQIAALPSRSRP